MQGDPAAFEAVYRHFEPEVRRWVMRIVRNGELADEVLVEAFWRAYRGRARFDPARSFGAWMRRIATHAEIADALGIPIGTVKSRVFHAVKALRRELGRMGIRQ